MSPKLLEVLSRYKVLNGSRKGWQEESERVSFA